jgi:hypothetical protein
MSVSRRWRFAGQARDRCARLRLLVAPLIAVVLTTVPARPQDASTVTDGGGEDEIKEEA